MTRITSDEVRHVANLARLAVTDEEVEHFQTQLEVILENAASISSLDTDNVVPTSHPLAVTNVFRADEVRPSLTQEEVLSNAPAAENGRFKIPQILGSDNE